MRNERHFDYDISEETKKEVLNNVIGKKKKEILFITQVACYEDYFYYFDCKIANCTKKQMELIIYSIYIFMKLYNYGYKNDFFPEKDLKFEIFKLINVQRYEAIGKGEFLKFLLICIEGRDYWIIDSIINRVKGENSNNLIYIAFKALEGIWEDDVFGFRRF